MRLLKSRLAAVAAPDRRDRIELIGIGYHWQNLSLAQGFDGVFGHNPLRLRSFKDATHVGDTVALPSQRSFSPLYPSYRSAFADLLGVRLIATGVPVEQIDSSLKPGDLDFIARTKDAYVYENPRALPRVMLLTDWRLADFEELMQDGWPGVDPRRVVLLKKAPVGFSRSAAVGMGGSARLLRYANTEVVVGGRRAGRRYPPAQRCLAPVVARERRWRRGGNPPGQRDLSRRGLSARAARGAFHLPSLRRRFRGTGREVDARTLMEQAIEACPARHNPT